jgi:hypothetical protein
MNTIILVRNGGGLTTGMGMMNRMASLAQTMPVEGWGKLYTL